MKGRLTKAGFLEKNRRTQECPFTVDFEGLHRYCGTWCPAFREPLEYIKPKFDINSGKVMSLPSGAVSLQLCEMVGNLVFEEFIDETKEIK